MNMTKIHIGKILTTTLLRVALLLLMLAGVNGAWATTFFKQNYEREANAGTWVSQNNASGLSLITGDATYGNYIQFYGDNLGGPRTAYTSFYGGTDFYGDYTSYTIEFDAAVRTSSVDGYYTELVVASDGYSLAGNNNFTDVNSDKKNYLFLLKSANVKNTTTYYVNGGSTDYTIAANTWFHVKLEVDITNKIVAYYLTGGLTASGTYTINDGSSLKAKALVTTIGRGYYGTTRIDNIKLYANDGSYTYYVTSRLGSTGVGTQITSGTVTSGSSVTVAYPQYILSGTTLYRIKNNNSGDYYRQTITVNEEGQELVLYYNEGSTIEDVIYFKEAEDIEGATPYTVAAALSRGSMANTARFPDETVVETIPMGKYVIGRRTIGKSDDIKIIIGLDGSDLFTFPLTYSPMEEPSDEVTINKIAPLTVRGGDGSGRCLDWLYIKKKGIAFEISNLTMPLKTQTLGLYANLNATVESSNTSVATVVNNGDGTVTVIGVAPGSATITATDGAFTTTLELTVINHPFYWSSNVGSCRFTSVRPAEIPASLPSLTNTTGNSVTYSSSNTDVAYFLDPSDYNSIRLSGTGTTTISAASGIYLDSYTLTVTNAAGTSWDFINTYKEHRTANDMTGSFWTGDDRSHWNNVELGSYLDNGTTYQMQNNSGTDIFPGITVYATFGLKVGNLILDNVRGLWNGGGGDSKLQKFYVHCAEQYVPKGSIVTVYTTYGTANAGLCSSGGEFLGSGQYRVTGDEGITFLVTDDYRLSKIEVSQLGARTFGWESNSGSYPLMEINEDNTPKNMDKMVYLNRNIDMSGTINYTSSNFGCASFATPTDYTTLHLKRPGTTTITATMTTGGQTYTASYELTVTAAELTSASQLGSWDSETNVFTFGSNEGYINGVTTLTNTDFTGGGVVGLTATLGNTTESSLVMAQEHTENGFGYSMKSIDYNGWSFVYLPGEGKEPTMGSYMKLNTVQHGALIATGTFGASTTKLYNKTDDKFMDYTSISTTELVSEELEKDKEYYLYNSPYSTMYLNSFGFLPVLHDKQNDPDDKYDLRNVRRGMVVELVVGCTKANGISNLILTDAIAQVHYVKGLEEQTIETYAVDKDTDDPFTIYIRVAEGGDDVIIYSARAYYKEPELSLAYPLMAVYNVNGNWGTWESKDINTMFRSNTGIATAFDVGGLPTFSAKAGETDYSADFKAPTESSTFTKTGDIQLLDRKASIRSTGLASQTTITEATVSTEVEQESTARGYKPGDTFTATADIHVIPFPYTWDASTGATALKTYHVEVGTSPFLTLGPSCYKVYAPATEGTGTDRRVYSRYDYPQSDDLPNSWISIPVIKGMKVSITSYGDEDRVTGGGYPLQISNVTDTKGYATATLDIYSTSNTVDFIAKGNGYVDIYNRSDVNVYIERIVVSAPFLEFEDGPDPEVSWSATYQNRVINKPLGSEVTIGYSNTPSADQVASMTSDGVFTFKDLHAQVDPGTVTVEATATGTSGLEPCWGEYTIHLVNFYFTPSVYNYPMTGKSARYPSTALLEGVTKLVLNGVDWVNLTDDVRSKVTFMVSAPGEVNGVPNQAKGILDTDKQTGDLVDISIENPYYMEVRNDGQLIITAVYRKDNGTVSTVKATLTVNITMSDYAGFKYAAPIVSSDKGSYTFGGNSSDNPLVTDKTNIKYACEYVGKNEAYTSWTQAGTTLSSLQPGAYHVQALDANNADALIDEFYLTVAYPVQDPDDAGIANPVTSQSWVFNEGLSNKDGSTLSLPAGQYNDDWAKGMPTNRTEEYRYRHAINGSNGFIVKQTAGLVVIAKESTVAPETDASHIESAVGDAYFSAYTGPSYNYVYPNIGLHKSTLIIPNLPKGTYVAVAWNRTGSGNGNTVELENLLDLEGKAIDEIQFGASVTDVASASKVAGENQGYYTFRVAQEGNVSFTQNDKGTTRITEIHVYYGDPDIVNAADDKYYNSNATEIFKGSGMTQKLMAYKESNPDGTADSNSGLQELNGIITTEGEPFGQWLTNYLSFNAPNGQPEFRMVNMDVTLQPMTMDLSQTYFESNRGGYTVPGFTFTEGCWGKAIMSVGVRDDNGYLVGYRQYRLTVGLRTKQVYPKTWDFTRYFDNSTVKIENSPITVLETTENLNTKTSLQTNIGYPDWSHTTEATSTWADGNNLMTKSGTETYQQYGYNEYSSYYVDDASLACNLGKQNAQGFIIEEMRGLRFAIPEVEADAEKGIAEDKDNKLQWVMPEGNVGYGDNSYLLFNGRMTLAKVDDPNSNDYYVFIRSSRKPDAFTNIEEVASSDEYYGIVDESENQYVYHVTENEDITLEFTSDTQIYGIGVTNIKKNAIHQVGDYGWATESRHVDIDHTLTGYYTKHDLQAYEVKYEDYDLNTATVSLTEIKNTDTLTDGNGTEFQDRGYVAKGNGIVLRESNITGGNDTYNVPFFVPAITTTQPAKISTENMMRPNLVRKTYDAETEDGYTRFLLTNIHWTYNSTHDLSTDEAGGVQEADAAGFYRHHIWSTTSDAAFKNTMAANTAYMLVPTGQLPVAVWEFQSAPSGVRRNTIAIRFDDITDINGTRLDADVQNKTGWYPLNGVKLNGQPTKAGLYICSGRKVVVK